MKNIENLFVYGTLQKGKQHQSILGKIKGKWKKGYVNGKLYNISSGPDYISCPPRHRYQLPTGPAS